MRGLKVGGTSVGSVLEVNSEQGTFLRWLRARQYATLLQSDVAIVTPNKIANTLDFAYYEKLRRLGKRQRARYLYETTVGAATPMLQTLEDLRSTGDTIRRVEGVLAGTLSYVFNSVNRGGLFSIAVRETGYRLERDQIQVESLVLEELQRIPDADVYLERQAGLDAEWSDRALQSAAPGNGLTYLARFDGTTVSVRIAEVSMESPFVRLRASENAVQYYTDRHSPLPPTIQKIRAGPDATTRGVLADIIHTAIDPAA
jgi:aspartokinase/homoserine dehydrogenase 1